MRIQLRIDNLAFEIDTRNPRLLAEWLIEKMTDVDWTPATDCRFQVLPSWAKGPHGWQDPQPDWITDSRFLGFPLPARSPEEVVDGLAQELARYRKEQADDSRSA